MKVFPSQSYSTQLRPNDDGRWERLSQQTELQDSLVSVRTKGKLFIGQVSHGQFRLIRSPIGSGALCVFSGEFTGTSGTIDIQIHRAFRILLGIWLLLPIGMVAWGFYKEGFMGITSALIVIVLLAIVRGALDVVFRILSEAGIRELTEVLRLVEAKPIESKK